MKPNWIIHSGYLGTETPYEEKRLFYGGQPPKGYRSFYINHLGRHGARYLSSSIRVDRLLETLMEAKRQGSLLKMGEKLRLQVINFEAVTNHQYGLLTPLGKKEEYQMGMRMYQHFPTVFGRQVKASSSYMQRAKQSMFAFLEGLGHCTSSNDFRLSIHGQIDPVLRFFDLNEQYIHYKEKGDWHKWLDAFEERCILAKKWLTLFFSEQFILEMANPIQIATFIYDLYCNTFNMQSDLGFEKYFDRGLMCYFWENENVKQYLEKGPALKGEDLPTNIAFPLLENFLQTSDRAIKAGDISANLRFAHAETLIPLLSLLGVKGASQQTDDLKEVAHIWKDHCIAPMGANMWWVFFKGKEDQPILMLPLLNEHPVSLPIPSYDSCFYEWEKVRCYYKEVLKRLHLPQGVSLIEQVKNYRF